MLEVDQDVSCGKVVENSKLLSSLPIVWIILKTWYSPRMYDGLGFWILLSLLLGEMGVQASWSPPKESSDVRGCCAQLVLEPPDCMDKEQSTSGTHLSLHLLCPVLLRCDLRDAEEQMNALPSLSDLSFKPDLHHLAGPSPRQSHKDFWRLRFLGEPLPIPDWLSSSFTYYRG